MARSYQSGISEHGHVLALGLVANLRCRRRGQAPPHIWKDNAGKPIVFDGIDLSDSLLSKNSGKRESFVYFNGQTFGGMRVKNYKMLFTTKDTWLGPERPMKLGALYNLWWDPGNSTTSYSTALHPQEAVNPSPGRYSGQDNGWIALYINPVLIDFFDELKKYPNKSYLPWGEGLKKIVPEEYQ